MSDDDFSEPDAPPDTAPAPGQRERKPRNVAVAKRAGTGWNPFKGKAGPKGKAKPKKARVPVAEFIESAWRVCASFAKPIPPTARVLKFQAPVAGMLLEDMVKGTVVDTMLQPLARMAGQGEAMFALIGPPMLTTAITLNPAAGPFILPVLRQSLMSLCKVAGPRMAEAMAAESASESQYGGMVDDMLVMLFAQPRTPAEDTAEAQAEALAEEEAAIRRAQEAFGAQM
jgi:hypothetical protein